MSSARTDVFGCVRIVRVLRLQADDCAPGFEVNPCIVLLIRREHESVSHLIYPGEPVVGSGEVLEPFDVLTGFSEGDLPAILGVLEGEPVAVEGETMRPMNDGKVSDYAWHH